MAGVVVVTAAVGEQDEADQPDREQQGGADPEAEGDPAVAAERAVDLPGDVNHTDGRRHQQRQQPGDHVASTHRLISFPNVTRQRRTWATPRKGGEALIDKRRHTEVLRAAVALDGRRVVDIGCGAGGLAGWLARQGARVLGLDAQLAAVRRARAGGSAAAVAHAEALPLARASVDVAVIFNSLHHFPAPAAALAEARRVLAPAGTLYVAEPLAHGPYFRFMQPVDDETPVRARALAALVDADRLGLTAVAVRDYAHDVVVHDLESAIEGWLAVDPARADRVEGVRAELARRLAAEAVVTAEGHALEQPMRSWLLRPA